MNSENDIVITIFTMQGSQLFQQSYENSLPESIDVSNFNNGEYIVVVQQGTNLQSIRFVKE